MSYSRNWHFLPRSKLCFASGVAIFLFNEKILEKTFCEKSAIMIFMKTDDKLAHIRHSLAHLLAAAVLELYPNTKPTLGPAIENGFYYDFEFGTPISDKDLPSIEKKMREILKTWETFHGIEVSANEARDIFSDNPYKTELINEIASRNEKITLYYSGPKKNIPSVSDLLNAKRSDFLQEIENPRSAKADRDYTLHAGFIDLCRGGHVENPSKDINPDSFKLSHIAGAYWRGDEKNKMLTRVYGLAFNTEKELGEYEKMREEAEKRDHRKLGKELDLFTFSDLVGSGLPLFTPKGATMREAIVERLQNISKRYGYEKVSIPHIARIELYETSGHAAKFKDEFFYVHGAQSDQKFVMKPMNCPHHTQIYASKPRSYRDLPIRYNELTMQYRDEKPGQLLGLSRVRSISIDDAHIFCRPENIKQEVLNIVKIIEEFYSALNMWKKGETFWVSLSVRDPKTPEKYLGKDENWQKAEKYLEEVSKEMGLDAVRMEGEAAFYGPKLDFKFKDALNREWQLATAQIDFVQPERFGLEYTDKDGSRQTPVMIHRAIAGSLERFMGILIEHYAGAFPFWLAPVQVRVLPVGENQLPYAKEVFEELKKSGIRAELDESNETLGKKVRAVKLEKIPYWIVVGEKEMKENKVTLESRDTKISKVCDRTEVLKELF